MGIFQVVEHGVDAALVAEMAQGHLRLRCGRLRLRRPPTGRCPPCAHVPYARWRPMRPMPSLDTSYGAGHRLDRRRSKRCSNQADMRAHA
jgi:hypothetical protein